MNTLLIVEDVPALREQYRYDLERLGRFRALTAGTVARAWETLQSEPIDCVLLDLELPGQDGFDLLDKLARSESAVPVIVYTGTGSYDRCVRAVKLGASGFVDKAEPIERVLHEIEAALERSRLRREVHDLKVRLGNESSIVGESRAIRAMRQQIEKLAPIPSPVLITGESGTGKELVARDLHRAGSNPDGPFLAINGGALPETLVESELFGHERGAFTGADSLRRGAFESASGGTLFLDEVGELPLTAQVKLLRVLETAEVTRVGGSRPVSVDAKVVAATNRDLDEEARQGRFREDLLFRLNVHTVVVPPLRERLSDVPLLVAHFLERTAERFGQRPRTISAEAVSILEGYSWRRNNVRELRNAVERMVLAAEQEEITPADVPHEISDVPPLSGTLRDLKAQAERDIVVAALERCDWHLTNTAKELGLADHASLSKIMKRHGLSRKER